jgi:hypothetical protein
MQTANIDTLAKNYLKRSQWVVVGLTLAGFLVMSIVRDTSLVVTLCVSAVFMLVCTQVHGHWWHSVARQSPGSLAKFYLASSILRMLAAVVVYVVLVMLAHDRASILWRTLVFVIFYVCLLVFDCVYFARVEKKNNINA